MEVHGRSMGMGQEGGRDRRLWRILQCVLQGVRVFRTGMECDWVASSVRLIEFAILNSTDHLMGSKLRIHSLGLFFKSFTVRTA